MDEDDSQDELINCSTSHSRGKRAALWAISDDSDDSDVESEEGESESGDEEKDGQVNGDEEEEEEGNEEEDGRNGAFGGTSADLAMMSSDEDAEKCPICLNSLNSQPVATPENCEHYFCFDCILEWAKNANSCPVDRMAFNSIYLRKCYGGKVKKMITVQKPVKEGQEETVNLDLEQTNCEVCGGSDREDRLLLCDGCDAGYHMECLTPPLDSVPVEEWFCPECEANNRSSTFLFIYFF
uniref:PHD and ring finger domains 1 n=1 Tax=Haplochromis burtoni TaxID=8153 RepID=A0A3Q2X8N4_HAPBU